MIPDAHDPSKTHQPFMLTTDLALRMDPEYEKVSRRFLKTQMNSLMLSRAPGILDAIAIWDRKRRYLGPEVPEETLIMARPDSRG
jgi:catalase-peroxidase